MKEIGLTLGVVESRVSQIHSSAVLHLRTLLTSSSGEHPVQAAAKKEEQAFIWKKSSRRQSIAAQLSGIRDEVLASGQLRRLSPASFTPPLHLISVDCWERPAAG